MLCVVFMKMFCTQMYTNGTFLTCIVMLFLRASQTCLQVLRWDQGFLLTLPLKSAITPSMVYTGDYSISVVLIS